MGHPMGCTHQKQNTKVVDHKLIPNVPVGFLQIKNQKDIELVAKQSIPCVHTHFPPPSPAPKFMAFPPLSPFFMIFTTCERCEMVHEFMVAYHFCNGPI